VSDVRRKLVETRSRCSPSAVFDGLGLDDGSSSRCKALLDVHSERPILILGFAALSALIVGQFDLSSQALGRWRPSSTIGLQGQPGLPFIVLHRRRTGDGHRRRNC